MADKSKIEWTDATWTPIRARWFEPQSDGSGKERVGWHCEHVSEGCTNCYAETMNKRLGTGLPFKPGHRQRRLPNGDMRGDVTMFLDEKMLAAPLRWTRPRHIFVCSMTDLFADFVPDEWIDRVFAVMALAPRHTFQVLTKRPERARQYLQHMERCFHASPEAFDMAWGQTGIDIAGEGASDFIMDRPWPLPNVWLGTSAESQATADARIPHLLATPAAVRFGSAEPLLGPMDIVPYIGGRSYLCACGWQRTEMRVAFKGERTWCFDCGEDHRHFPTLNWLIVGGESGPGARPMHPDWARSLRDQCAAAGTAFFFKQWGEWVTATSDICPDSSMVRNSAVWLGWDSRQAKPSHDGLDNPVAVQRIGKKAAGRLLDGRTHDEVPTP